MAEAKKSIASYRPGSESGVHMRRSRLLQRIRDGKIARVFKLNTCDARLVEVAAMSGFDCLWLGQEHIPAEYKDLENQVRAAKIHDTDVMIRVPRGSYSDYIKPLEMDACGIMVPHVMNAEDARRVVSMTKFPPVGRRAVDGGNADGAWCRVEFLEYLETANRERFVICQIEDPEAVEEIEAIAETEGVDGLFFGAGDYSVAIGKPGQMEHPDIIAVRKRVAYAARNAGKIAGVMATPVNTRAMMDMGYNFLNLGADVIGLAQYCDGLMAALSEIS